MILPVWAAQYGNIPYKELGRDRAGIDCWGLVKLIMLEQYGKDIPDLIGEYADQDDKKSIVDCYNRYKFRFTQIAEPKCGAIVMFNIEGVPVHIGVMLNEVHFIHASEGRVSGIDRITHPIWKSRIEGFYWRE